MPKVVVADLLGNKYYDKNLAKELRKNKAKGKLVVETKGEHNLNSLTGYEESKTSKVQPVVDKDEEDDGVSIDSNEA